MDKPKYNHAEAFCLMHYKCDKCKAVEILWNSRDGVTPFIIGCRCCDGEMQHTDWNKDLREIDFFPEVGMRVFIDFTPEIANIVYRMVVNKRWENLKENYKTKREAFDAFMKSHKKDKGEPYVFTIGEGH